MIPRLCPFEFEIKMADEDEIFQKFRGKTPEWMADFEKPCFSLELEIFKSTTNDAEIKCTHAKPSESGSFYPVHFPHNITWSYL